ncbi:hypothetical protein GCM10009557_55650 [Virgisporangium ochraceum]|uniref:LPXTG-motif cell wall anchor domain protein n=1 Tax=Virgisporangium ochraceum TaxID=65505 RepID=A0A8J3ZUR1_9ACTN|nr:hypothetical protein [Virgisporangium ochraceum]GIJ67821.1 hypothetical protein Voc01_027380 [Virgisporangium ochraceum]
MLLSRVAGRYTYTGTYKGMYKGTAAALLVTVVALIGLPRPALAAEPRVGLVAFFDARAVAIGTAGKEVPIRYGAYSVEGATLPATVTVKIDASGAADVLSARLAEETPGCTVAGAVFTCTKETDDVTGPDGDFSLVFTAASGAKAGDTGQIRITVSAPDVQAQEQTHELVVSEPGADLLAADFTTTSTPGGAVTFQPLLRNQGDRAAETVVLTLGGDRFAKLTDRFGNCHYAPEPTSVSAVCVFKDLNIEPGGTVIVTMPIKVEITPDVPARTFAYYRAEVWATVDNPSGEWSDWPLGNGSDLVWAPVDGGAQASSSDVDMQDNQGNVLVTTPANPSDVVANGATVTGAVGDTVTAKVGLTNKGPGYIDGVYDSETSNPENPYNAAFVVTFPAGVEVTKVENPEGDGIYCHGKVGDTYDTTTNQPGRLVYRCMKWTLAVNETHTVTFTVKIASSVTAAGSVVARGGSSDPVTANNTAEVKFTNEGGLPITGPDAALTATVGALMVAAGCGLILVSRRRDDAAVTD